MPRFSFQFDRSKLKAIFDVRARLIVLALILVVPLMLDRVRVLEESRAHQVKAASSELVSLARRGAHSQREMMKAVEGFLKTSASIFVYAQRLGRPCALLELGLKVNLNGIGNISVVSKEGRVLCSTLPALVGLDITDRPYFHDALVRRQFVLSDYLIGKANKEPSVMAAYPTAAIDPKTEAVIVTSVALSWFEELLGRSPLRAGMTLALVDGNGVVIAKKSLRDDATVSRAAIDKVVASSNDEVFGSVSSDDSSERLNFASARIPETNARLIVSMDRETVLGSIERDIRAAYLQLGLVGVLVLLGAWFMSERLILRPIRLLTNAAVRFGAGDFSARAVHAGLPPEFSPLARAFNGMATKLAERERELLSSNNQLTVLASIDAVSGLANRRGFDNRLDFEWIKGEQEHTSLALAMIDIDHFKLFNDTYGHLEGDACLAKVGNALLTIAHDAKGFVARYGGEEFALMLPGADDARIADVSERIRAAIESLAILHTASPLGRVTVSVGAAVAMPSPGQNPLELVEAADAGLYAAKRRGRNAVVQHGAVRMVDRVVALAS